MSTSTQSEFMTIAVNINLDAVKFPIAAKTRDSFVMASGEKVPKQELLDTMKQNGIDPDLFMQLFSKSIPALASIKKPEPQEQPKEKAKPIKRARKKKRE